MTGDLMWLGGVVIAVAGVVGMSGRRARRPQGSARAARAVREAMSGPEGRAVRAEFQRSGIQPPDVLRPRAGYLFPIT
jgi:hypothetical protein